MHKLRLHPDFVAPFSPPCEGGGAGGVVAARPVTRASHALSLSVLSHSSCEARRIALDFQCSRITPPAWAGEKCGLAEAAPGHLDVVAPHPPLAKGGSGGVVPARPVTRSSHALSRLRSFRIPLARREEPSSLSKCSRITSPAPPSQGGKEIAPSRRHCVAHNKNTRIKTVAPARSTPTFHHPTTAPLRKGGKGIARSRRHSIVRTKTRVSKPSLQLSQHQLFTGPLGDSRSQRTGGSEDPARTSGTNLIGKKTRVNRNFEESGRYGLGMGRTRPARGGLTRQVRDPRRSPVRSREMGVLPEPGPARDHRRVPRRGPRSRDVVGQRVIGFPGMSRTRKRTWDVAVPCRHPRPVLRWHAAKSSLTKLWGWQERGWFCCAAFREFAVQPGQPVVTTPVRALVQTGNLQPRASARSAAFERSSVGLTAEVGGCARPNHVLTHVVTLRMPRRFEFAGVRDRNGQQNRDDLEPTSRPTFHHPCTTNCENLVRCARFYNRFCGKVLESRPSGSRRIAS